MASEVQICNMALARLGIEGISSRSDTTKAAQECDLIFDDQRDFLLASHPWGFAEKRVDLTLDETEEYDGYTYAYTYPPDALHVAKVFDGANLDTSIAFSLGQKSDLTTTVILTDMADAVAIYTAAITNPVTFSPLFLEAFVCLLASRLVKTMDGDTGLMKEYHQQYLRALEESGSGDANEGFRDPNGENPIADAMHS